MNGAERVVRRRLTVSGTVQSVGYRMACARRAREAGVNGSVRNCPDGSVEVVLEGAERAVDELTAWCEHGPPLARVQRVRVVGESPLGETAFSIA